MHVCALYRQHGWCAWDLMCSTVGICECITPLLSISVTMLNITSKILLSVTILVRQL